MFSLLFQDRVRIQSKRRPQSRSSRQAAVDQSNGSRPAPSESAANLSGVGRVNGVVSPAHVSIVLPPPGGGEQNYGGARGETRLSDIFGEVFSGDDDTVPLPAAEGRLTCD